MTNTFQTILSHPDFINNDNEHKDTKLNSILTNLALQLNCSICQDIPTQPYLLPSCGHTFCYSCIKYWFQCNPTCPICRSIIGDNKPILNHSLKQLIDTLLKDLKDLINAIGNPIIVKKLFKILDSWYLEKDNDFQTDKNNNFPWLKKLNDNWGRAVVDNEDGVPRCSACHWELIDGLCENCGRRMVGWQDRSDGDELNDLDDGDDIDVDDDDDDDENLVHPRRQRFDSDDDEDWNDFDNGLNDMRSRPIVDMEADESGGEGNDDDDDDFDNHPDEYESDDGFVVDEDEEDEEEEDSNGDEDEDKYINASDVEIINDSLASGDEDIIGQSKSNSIDIDATSDDSDTGVVNRRKKKITFSDDDDDEDDEEDGDGDDAIDLMNDDDDDDNDEKFIQKLKSRRKQNIIEDDEEEDDDKETALLQSNPISQIHKEKHKPNHKHKHKHKHKKRKY